MIFYNKKVQGTTAAETRLKLVSKKIKCYLGFTNFSFTTYESVVKPFSSIQYFHELIALNINVSINTLQEISK